jgi:erythromycin esterase
MAYKRTFLFALLFSIRCASQCNEALRTYSTGFDSLSASSFSFLDSELKDVRVVGYGEDTHGTAEFTVLAKELMEYLSEKHGFKLVIIETGFGEGLYLNDYIQGKEGDLKTLLKDHNSTWRYRTTEFYAFMNWLRDYNKNHDEKITLYGCEMQYVISDVHRVQEYLKSVGASHIVSGFEKHLWQDISNNEKLAYFNSYFNVKQLFIAKSEDFIKKSSQKEFDVAYHHIEVLGQFATAINQNAEQRKHDFRDIYMGENIKWILDFHGNTSKSLYWAHNAHVGDWVHNGIVDVTGHQLRKIYGPSYFSIATDFGFGEFVAFSLDWKLGVNKRDHIDENTFTACLKSFGSPNTFLNLRQAKKDNALHLYLDVPLTSMAGAGAQVRTSDTETELSGKAFDAIIYLDQTNKIHWADKNEQ